LAGWHLFRVKDITAMSAEAGRSGPGLRRVLGPVHLTLLGVGATVGAGIFALVGTAAAGDADRPGAGPALVVSLALVGLACLFTALCYAEFAARVPISGSAYTYAYATLGELVAWIIGWDLILEYAVGNVAVAVSWSGYFCDLLRGLGIDLPLWLTKSYSAASQPDVAAAAPHLWGHVIVFNLPAVLIVAAITGLLVLGIRESAWLNAVMVGVKLAVLAFFVIVGAFWVKPANWTPFAPHGWAGIHAGAAVMFFAFIGFDAVSTTAEECRNPRRDLPIGIISSLVACTAIYAVVSVVLTGMIPSQELNTAEPLSAAMRVVRMPWAAGIVAFGSVVAHTAVLLVFQLGQPRILLSMARDGLLPARLARTHPRFRTPHVATILTGLFVAGGAAASGLEAMADLCNIGTLSAFVIVCLGVIGLRWRESGWASLRARPWKLTVPALGAASCLYLMLGLPKVAWWRFVVWLAVGLAFYLAYGFRHSRLRTNDE
jgi:APA family basic amino acid/polyamine antiporter